MALLSQSGGQLVGQGIAQNRTTRVLGGAPPYSLTLIGGALPAGLHIDSTGAIVGTPTTLGESNFEVLVTDAVGASVSQLRTLAVVPAPAAPAAPSNLTATATSPATVALSWQDNAGGTAAFSIQASQDGGPFLAIQSVRPQNTSTTITGLSPATTNVHVILRVTDTATGAVRHYEVPYGPPFTPLQDTSAFGTCGLKAAPDASPDAASALRQRTIADLDARLRSAATAAAASTTSAASVASVASGKRPPPPAEPAVSTICSPSATALCLNNNRFQVQATFDAGAAGSGTAHVGPLTSDTGYLWFFSPDNVEAVVKVLDGCGLGAHYWVFAGGLTNVAVTLTVTDTQTGISKQYNNPASTTFEPVQDTMAFSTCP